MNIKLDLPIDTVNFMLQALAELPYKNSAPVIDAIQRQTQEQMKPHGVPNDVAKVNSG